MEWVDAAMQVSTGRTGRQMRRQDGSFGDRELHRAGDRRNVLHQERSFCNAVCLIHWGTFRLSRSLQGPANSSRRSRRDHAQPLTDG
jgi:hypothetical protein